MKPSELTSPTRKQLLREAEKKALALFREVDSRSLIHAGITEKQLNAAVYQLAFEMYGIKKYWHKRIVRAGPNTLFPYREDPPDLLIKDDDILFLDFGPVFEDWEADLGRTYVLGSDPIKLKLQRDIEEAWHIGKAHYDSSPDVTGAELYQVIHSLAVNKGWEFSQAHCGHLIGNFPHERLQDDQLEKFINPKNDCRMRDPDENGGVRDWILEIHFIDREREIGGFFEQLMNVE